MTQKKNSLGLALASMAAGVAAMPVVAFFNTFIGLGLAGLSIYFVYLSS